MAARGPQNGRRGLERGLTLGYWPSKPLLLNKFFDPSTPSMRKGDDGGEKKNGKKKRGKKKKKKKIKTFLVATNVVASRLPERRPTATATAPANPLIGLLLLFLI